MSEEGAILPRCGIRVDSSAPQQQGITVDNHPPNISIDELLDTIIKGSNGMPVLLITSSNGRPSAIAVNGVRNVVPTNHEVNGSTEKNFLDFRAWLLLIMSLVATVTFTAGLTPPGGFWAADDKDNGYIAGTSVMRDKFYRRYIMFQLSNTVALFSSLVVIGALVTNTDKELFSSKLFPIYVSSCFLMLGGSFITGTWDDNTTGIATTSFFVCVLITMSRPLVKAWYLSRTRGEQPADMNNS